MSKAMAGDTISLAAGLVDSATLPAEEIAAVMPDFFRERGRLALQYGTNEGLESLRRKVLSRIEKADGVPGGLDLGRVLLSTGSQQMLYILTEIMVDPGDIVITAAPSYFVYLGTLETAGAEIVGIPADENGMRVDLLAAAIERIVRAGKGASLKMIYVTTYYDNPTGASLSLDRRKALLETVESFDGIRPLVIEDAAYRDLGFAGKDVPSLWSFDERRDRVAYLGTFSKPFSPGLRTGYAVLPEELVEKVKIFKCGHDFGSASFSQQLIDFAIDRGIYDRNVAILRKTYAAKCRLMCGCLERELAGLAGWREPEGGLYVWLDFGDVDTGLDGAFFSECAREGVLYVPGEFCYPDRKNAPKGRMRLSFGPTSAADIEKGVARLSAALSARSSWGGR
jgi:2-aminoadipate transaminase